MEDDEPAALPGPVVVFAAWGRRVGGFGGNGFHRRAGARVESRGPERADHAENSPGGSTQRPRVADQEQHQQVPPGRSLGPDGQQKGTGFRRPRSHVCGVSQVEGESAERREDGNYDGRRGSFGN